MQTALTRTLPAFSQIEWRNETGSTNADLMLRARNNQQTLARPWLLGTHLQSRGRGRAGRTWQNRSGANLMFSCAFDVFIPARSLATLTSYIGALSCQALRQLISQPYQKKLNLKWPNDILWDGAKLAGILIESTRSSTSKSADHHLIVIGLGMNLADASTLSNKLDRNIADWRQIIDIDANIQKYNAIDIVTCLANTWYTGLNQVSAYGFVDLAKNYSQYDALLNKSVNVIDNDTIIFSGTAVGIDEFGHLLVDNGITTKTVTVGEISIRALP